MGLDMYAYVAARAGQQAEFYEGSEWDPDHKDHRNPNISKPREIAYWRKHPNLHGWMARLWLAREANALRESNNFNGVELELTAEDLDNLEAAVKARELPSTTGFFFGNESDNYYQESDLKFIQDARAEMFFGFKVFYNSSW